MDWDYNDPIGTNPAALNGFVITAANDARQQSPTLMDTNGIRAMGYFDGSDLNYYYFMASNFATSDRWFSPAMDRTQINRMYLLAAHFGRPCASPGPAGNSAHRDTHFRGTAERRHHLENLCRSRGHNLSSDPTARMPLQLFLHQ